VNKVIIAVFLTLLMLSAGCLDGDSAVEEELVPNTSTAVDITNVIFDNNNSSCLAYVGDYYANPIDKSTNEVLPASVNISATDDQCIIYSNGIPNHDFAVNGSFATKTAAVWETFTIPINPQIANQITALSLSYDNAVFLNGVKLDLLAAACYGVGPDPLGKEKVGCFESDTPWRYDPMHPNNDFGEDDNHAHTQPDGAYHYHGDPASMYDTTGTTISAVIGYAADGFPIRGPFVEDNGTIRAIESGYVLRDGNRTNQDGEGDFPGGAWSGQFRDDFHWQDGVGDLDQCNGRVVDGTYSYYVTFTYPWVIGCFVGTPDDSFRKGRA